MSRIGVIGMGVIGRAVAEYAIQQPTHSLAFARNRSQSVAAWADRTGVTVRFGTPSDGDLAGSDLVVEAAHPQVVADQGARILEQCDLLVVSAGALADPALLAALTHCAKRAGTNLIIPLGALVGLDGALAQSWTEARITMVKSPKHLDPPPADVSQLIVLHEGPVGPLAARYPRNVNAMVTFALATVGLDRTVTKLVCDPGATFGQLEMELSADDGSTLRIDKAQPMIGVSGSEMTRSILRTVNSVCGWAEPGLRFA